MLSVPSTAGAPAGFPFVAELLCRYGPAVRHHLEAVLADAHAADDVFQEFCLRLVRGDFRDVCPERGRFRCYLKTVLHHLVAGWHKQRSRHQPGAHMPADDVPEAQAADSFLGTWRAQLLRSTWRALRRQEEDTAQPVYRVLRFHVAHAN